MNVINNVFPQSTPNNDKIEQNRIQGQIAATLEKHLPNDITTASPVSDLYIARSSTPKPPMHIIHNPSLCIIAQGAKNMKVGGDSYFYDKDSFLLITQTMPAAGTIMQATEDHPYLGMLLSLERQQVADIALSIQDESTKHLLHSQKKAPVSSVTACEYDLPLLEAINRLSKLLDTPQDIEFMAPVIKREIIYRLLKSPAGQTLAQMVINDSHSNRISKVISMIREKYAEPLRLSELAEHAHMSVSSLQSHFKTITQLSPIQFQKQIRLHEARRIMMTEFVDAAAAGARVGYNNQSQFSREYRRMFGTPPYSDIKKMKQ